MVSESHQDMLYRAGWTEDRCVDTSEWERQLLDAGYPPISPIVRAFMQNFAGLKITVLHPPHYMEIEFIAPTTSSEWDYWDETLEYIICKIDEPLFPLGYNTYDMQDIAITNHGVIYGHTDGYLIRFTPLFTHPLAIMERYLSRRHEYLDSTVEDADYDAQAAIQLLPFIFPYKPIPLMISENITMFTATPKPQPISTRRRYFKPYVSE